MNGISVIVPVFNGEKTLEACLASISSQLTENDELIVIDDCSTDKTLSVATTFSARVIRNAQNLGAAASRNLGTEKASGTYFVFIDCDVVLQDSELEIVRKYLDANKDVHALTGSLDPDLVKHNFYTDYKNLYMNYIFTKCDRQVNFIYGSFCAIRKESFEPWPVDPRLGEDSHWGYLLTNNNKKIHYLPQIRVIHLKEYSIGSLARNDFQIAYNFTLIFIRYKRWNTIYGQEKFGHTTKHQKLSLALAVLATISVFITPSLAIIISFIWLILNLEFLVFLENARDFSFFMKSLIWTYIDHLIYSAGILKGCIAQWRKQ